MMASPNGLRVGSPRLFPLFVGRHVGRAQVVGVQVVPLGVFVFEFSSGYIGLPDRVGAPEAVGLCIRMEAICLGERSLLVGVYAALFGGAVNAALGGEAAAGALQQAPILVVEAGGLLPAGFAGVDGVLLAHPVPFHAPLGDGAGFVREGGDTRELRQAQFGGESGGHSGSTTAPMPAKPALSAGRRPGPLM